MTIQLQTLLSRFLYTAPLSFFGGAIASLSMAPTNFSPVLFISFPLLYLCLHYARSKKTAFSVGWLFGFGYFVFSLSWVGNALLVEGNPYKWAWPLAISGLPVLLAFFTGFAGLICQTVDLKRYSGFMVFVGVFFTAEFLRGHLFTGFPWNLYGYTWTEHLAAIQILHIGGVYILTALTIFWASCIGPLILKRSIFASLVCGLALLSFCANYAYGLQRMNHAKNTPQDTIQIRLVQPNIAQADKWDSRKMSSHFAKLLDLSTYDGTGTRGKVTHIIWPETAIRDWFIKDKGALNAIRAMLQSYPDGAYLFTGILMHDTDKDTYTNSLIMISSEGVISNIYDKHHLVPFGEYIPFQKYIPLEPVAKFKGMEAGDGLKTFQTPEGLRYSPLVCYEILFPGRSILNESAPDFIINVTNDAWYGFSAGPYQHFIQAQYRAIENEIPVLRVANTGFTGAFTPFGHVLGGGKLFKDYAETIDLPIRNNPDNT